MSYRANDHPHVAKRPNAGLHEGDESLSYPVDCAARSNRPGKR